ncbi:VanZ family protein [Paucisalibacillus globulus]|jgi:glycopeptide antibiotics resistance protein|uniref:VanZ family protein n=1 Tax=Paucisalibacillus globulus TaxID=351095 RepID=UPI000BB87496|nr:VanZ family protein [Paucisalibacillus globulus]
MDYINDLPILFIAITLFLYIPLRISYRKKMKIKNNKLREITFILLIAYGESLLYLTLFPTSSVVPNHVSINLIPFKTINLYINHHQDFTLQVINLLGNVVVFIPIGIFVLLLLNRVTFFKVSFIGLGSTLFIEVMQLLLSINGVISRSFDVDDLILNTAGVIIGYAIGTLGRKFFPL